MSAAGSIAANVALFRPFIKATVDKMVQTLFADDDDIESDPTLGVLTGAEQNALLDGIFTHFDADGDGKLNLSELRHFLCKNFEASAVYMPDLTVEARTAASRAKGLSEDEIAVEMKRVRSVNQQRADEIRESIDRVGDMVGGFMEMIDTDRDGFVSRSEMAIHLFEVEAQTDDEAVIVDYDDPFDGFSIIRAVKATMNALAAGELQSPAEAANARAKIELQMIQVAEIRSAYTKHFTQFSNTLAKCSSDALAQHARNMKLPQNASVEDVVRTFKEGPLSGVLAAVAECEARLGECMLRLAPQSAALE